MEICRVRSKDDYDAALERLAPGDGIEIESFAVIAESAAALLEEASVLEKKGLRLRSLSEQIDTGDEKDAAFFRYCRQLRLLEPDRPGQRHRKGIERARQEGRYKGRKPIAVDEALFDSVVALWKCGEITAREAMSRLDLKPNTFYRRVKESEAQKMKEFKEMEKSISGEAREAARQSRRELDELKKQVRSEAREVKKAAHDKMDAHDVKREIRREKRQAEAEHAGEVQRLKRDVEAETQELKKLLQD